MKRLIILQVCTFAFLITATVSARAEYYMVSTDTVYYSGYPGYSTYNNPPIVNRCGSCCKPKPVCCRTTCCRSSCGGGGYYSSVVYYNPTPIVYMNYVSPHVYNRRGGSEEVAQYAWVPYP